MRSSRFVVSLSLVLFAPLGFGQDRPQTEAQQDGLIGAVKSVSTIVENSDVRWQQPSGPTLVTPAFCRDCEYTSDGYRTKSGQVVDGKFLGETIALHRDGSGHVTDLTATSTLGNGPARHEVRGPFGKTEQTIYQDGKVNIHQTFLYDASGNLQETISRSTDGSLMGRTITTRSSDGAWSDESWGKDERLEAMNSFNPATGEQRSTTFDESGNVTIGTSDLVRYGPGFVASIAHTSASTDPAVLAMDWELARKHLTRAEAAIVNGLRHIAKQQLKIEQLRGGGHDTAYAESLLRVLLDLQHRLEEYSSRLQARLTRMAGAVRH